MIDLRKAPYKELRAFVIEQETLTEEETMAITYNLGSMLWDIGWLYDRVTGTDARKGKPIKYGTPNRRSMTYKLRKAAGYSYP